jgi:crotonobetainyl-CoA:carnitine CoA-transferase CaiB-like acyl-CoA transferase
MQHVMDGYTILDFSHFLAGPAATRLFAEMGAEVIKVEMSPGGDGARLLPYIKDGRSAFFVQQNRGKKSLCIDVKDPDGLAIIKDLLHHVDVVIENFSAGAIGRMGLGWEDIKAINPAIVMCSITTFGQSGPMSDMVGYDPIAQAYAGVTSMIGEKDGMPGYPMISLGDTLTGVHAVAAINAALLYKEKTGIGQFLDISLLDAYFHHHDLNVQIASCTNGEISPSRNGPHHYTLAPTGIFKGRDSYMFIVAMAHQWPAFCKAIGREDIIEDPRFDTNENRVANVDALVAIVEDWIQTQENDKAAIKVFEKARIPVAPILSVEEVMELPHVIERRTVRSISDRALPDFQVPGMPLRFSEFPDELPLDAPFLGEHNREILREYLALDEARLTELEDNKVLIAEAMPS